jgi:hypothetical protein
VIEGPWGGLLMPSKGFKALSGAKSRKEGLSGGLGRPRSRTDALGTTPPSERPGYRERGSGAVKGPPDRLPRRFTTRTQGCGLLGKESVSGLTSSAVIGPGGRRVDVLRHPAI